MRACRLRSRLDWEAAAGERRSSLTPTAEATPSLASIAGSGSERDWWCKDDEDEFFGVFCCKTVFPRRSTEKTKQGQLGSEQRRAEWSAVRLQVDVGCWLFGGFGAKAWLAGTCV